MSKPHRCPTCGRGFATIAGQCHHARDTGHEALEGLQVDRQGRKDVPDRHARAKWPDLVCADCGGALKLTPMPDAWRRRGAADPRIWVYLCERRRKGCKGLLSAHPNGEPCGTPADQETRTARHKLHHRFDALWKGRPGRVRERAYAVLAARLGIPRDHCHIALFSLEECRKAWVAIRDLTADMVLDEWTKLQGAD